MARERVAQVVNPQIAEIGGISIAHPGVVDPADIPGKPRVFMPYLGYAPYVGKCNEVAGKGYAGFDLSR